jgi:imidazolonepropionase-like amidohydrolase
MKSFILHNARLIDGSDNEPFLADIFIKNSLIEKVEPKGKTNLSSDIPMFDLKKRTIMPGLIDCHVHLVAPLEANSHEPFWKLNTPPSMKILCAEANALKTLKAGFTTVRNCGGLSTGLPEDIFLRNAINSGYTLGPRILACANGISMTGGHGDRGFPAFLPSHPELGYGDVPADGPTDCRRAVRRKVKAGADFIKTFTTGGASTPGDGPHSVDFTMEELKALVEEAHAHKKKVAVHAVGTQGIRNAVEAGVDTVEHGSFLDRETAEKMKAQGTSLITTLAIYKAIINRGKSYPNQEAIRKARVVSDANSSALALARQVGLNIAMGTDASGSIRNGENASEFVALVEEGLSPREAIGMATANAAKALGLEKSIGTIEPGKKADLIIVNGDPLANISLLTIRTNIRMVIKSGKIVCFRESGENAAVGSDLPKSWINRI